MKYFIAIIFMYLSLSVQGQSVSNKIEFVAKSDLDHYKEVISLKFAESEKALQIQATEYERRLEVLNHEAAQLKEMQSTYLPREVFEASQKELQAKIESLQKIVWIGIGIVMVLQIAVGFFLKSVKVGQS